MMCRLPGASLCAGAPSGPTANCLTMERAMTPTHASSLMMYFFGGRWRLRTSDPSSVNAVLYP